MTLSCVYSWSSALSSPSAFSPTYVDDGIHMSLLRALNCINDGKQKANKNQRVTVGKDSEKGKLCLVERETVEYEVKVTLATLKVDTQLPASSERFKAGLGCGSVESPAGGWKGQSEDTWKANCAQKWQ